MQVLDIIPVSPKETFLIGYLAGPVPPGQWALKVNGETMAVLDILGEAQVQAGPKGKLAPPRVLECRGPVDRRAIDFTRDEVTLERPE
ncbi:hypothetical protein [Hymenobacter psychrotolerans]|uniref:Uncharacterized protein n=1 Tax=Hymenobacter psychrotolerans DSM 18569 TaxID=1121959 RepID=A0A1M7D327_9BACT|nr:hypothetical protein [Hymenobacter psychrotolerans]SHL73886.1 hypothetical protein SAMN02746009_03285 [Hymenobacter psychrotolerans DSM 18569]